MQPKKFQQLSRDIVKLNNSSYVTRTLKKSTRHSLFPLNELIFLEKQFGSRCSKLACTLYPADTAAYGPVRSSPPPYGRQSLLPHTTATNPHPTSPRRTTFYAVYTKGDRTAGGRFKEIAPSSKAVNCCWLLENFLGKGWIYLLVFGFYVCCVGCEGYALKV